MNALARRAAHQEIMDRAFPRLRPVPRGTAPTYPENFAWLFGDENEALPERTEWLPDPIVNNGHVVHGASVTIAPAQRMDPLLVDLPRREEPQEAPLRLEETWVVADAAADVREWLEGLGEPLTVMELVAVTGHSEPAVSDALRWLRRGGKVARQPTSGAPVWVWRRAG
jgi:hypothetical protein